MHNLQEGKGEVEVTAGLVDGKHYTEYVESVKEFKRQGRLDEAVTLLLRLIKASVRVSHVKITTRNR